MSEFKVGDRVEVYFGDDKCEGIIKKIRPNDGICEVSLDGYNTLLVTAIDDISRITKEKKKTTLEQLEQRIEKLEKCVMGEQNSLEKCENVSSMSKNGLLTEDERVILRNLNECWKWIVRDEDGFLSAWGNKPYGKKIGKLISWRNDIEILGLSLPFNDNILKFIKNKDEPYNIEELLKVECGNEN